MARSVRLLSLAGTLLAAGTGRAAPCEPSAQVTGDPALVATVGELLARHGIKNEGGGCPVVRVRIERRGSAILVVRVGEPTEERVVSEPATAAIVIESWCRSDFEHPLLAIRPLVVRSAPTPEGRPREGVTQTAPDGPSSSLQVFAAMETSVADDRTKWVGGVLGVCVQLGRACAFARGRFATVVDGPGMWSEAERHAADVLFGGDLPFDLGTTTLTVGLGAGMGAVHPGTRASGTAEGSQTFGLRADAHLAWTIRLGARLSLELSAAVDVAQVTDVEGSSSRAVSDEPHLFGRLGAGLRYGGQ